MKLTSKQKRLLLEAFRRNSMKHSYELSKPILCRWLGLGTEAAYRPVLQAGLMRWWDGRKPAKRCMGWLCLTEKGLEVLFDSYPEFQRDLEYRSKKPFDNYVLANGVVA